MYVQSMIRKAGSVNPDSLDNINLFSIITIMSLILIALAVVVMEGITFSPAYMEAIDSMSGVHLDSFGFTLLPCIPAVVLHDTGKGISCNPLSGQLCKAMVVIVSSVVFFQTPVSFVNSMGTGIALAGVFLYSRLKRTKLK